MSNKSEKSSQSKSWFTVEKDFIRIKTTTFSLWSIFASGGPRRKRAIVFASRPDPRSDLIHLRFYVYSDNEDSQEVGYRLSDRNEDGADICMIFVIVNHPAIHAQLMRSFIIA